MSEILQASNFLLAVNLSLLFLRDEAGQLHFTSVNVAGDAINRSVFVGLKA